ncbi:hypothetical protein MTR67_053401 [Solanum verrucosum]|uniref:Uncharacterized protein n=1 Tax=Solanum verrucosum TaxID=315347 RepID=A0AAF1A1X0_SOLVR|nr:hypothetical protein MTR67_053401 [Solanum verrucosum]
MSLFPLPKKVLKKLDKLRRNFLWHGCKENNGYNLVKWDTTLNNRYLGGLGIRNPKKQNDCLLMKWLWRYNDGKQVLWKDVIKCKYGENNPWCSNESSLPYRVGVWRTIRDLWPMIKENTVIKVGDGRKTKFWEEAWNTQIPLKDIFLDLFTISNNPEATVKACWTEQ